MLEQRGGALGRRRRGHATRGRHRVKIADTKLGKILTDPNGRILYAFTVDKDGKSAVLRPVREGLAGAHDEGPERR
jgi:hypothetical protein